MPPVYHLFRRLLALLAAMPTTPFLPKREPTKSRLVVLPRPLVNYSARLHSISLSAIIHGATCPPLALRDLEHYLAAVEHSPEGLRFLIWWHHYRTRYYALPDAVRARSFGASEPQCPALGGPSPVRTHRREQASIQVSADLRRNYAQRQTEPPPIAIPLPVQISRSSSVARLLSRGPTPTPISPPSSPFSPSFNLRTSPREQPLRAECDRAIATFLHPGASAELNLSETVRETAARDLTWNTHPDVWLPVYEEVYEALERDSLPRFLSFAMSNINLPRQIVM